MDLGFDFLCKFGLGDKCHDVRVVGEVQYFLLVGGFILGCRSDSNGITSSQVRELEFQSKDIPCLSTLISNLEFICVLVQIEDL